MNLFLLCPSNAKMLVVFLLKAWITTMLHHSQEMLITGSSGHEDNVTVSSDWNDRQYDFHTNEKMTPMQKSNGNNNQSETFHQTRYTSIGTSKIPGTTTLLTEGTITRVPEITLSPDDIFHYLKTETRNNYLNEHYSCAGKCGDVQRERCSCRPSCMALKSCCIDFSEVCVNRVFPLKFIQDKYRWLQDVDVTCNNGNLVIASCPVNRVRDNHNDSLPNEQLYSYRQIRIDSFNPIELTRMLAQGLTDSNGLSVKPEIEWLLSTVAIEDASSGLSYINASVFECNGAHWPSAKPWDVRISYLHDIILSEDRIVSLESILSVLDFGNAFSVKEKSDDPCRSDGISSCPARYRFSEINDACQSTTLYIQVTDTFGNAKVARNFKNPFCQACREAYDTRNYLKILRITKSGGNGMKFLIKSNEISVIMPHNIHERLPSWSRLTCNLNRSHLLTSMKNMSSLHGFILGATSTVGVQSHCVIAACAVSRKSEKKCYEDTTWGLLLPPAIRALTNKELLEIWERFFKVLRTILVEWEPYVLNGSMEIKRDSFYFRSREVQYAFTFRMATNAVLGHMVGPRWEKLPDLLAPGLGFPFQMKNPYFCLVLDRYHSPSFLSENYHHYRCWDLPERFVATRQPEPKQPPQRGDVMKHHVGRIINSYPTAGSVETSKLPSTLAFLACLIITSIAA